MQPIHKQHVVNPRFNAGCADRARYPLFQGKYKIIEFHDRANEFLRTIDNIQSLKRAKKKSISEVVGLGCCVSTIEDQTTWLQALPRELSWLYGYKLLAGINALQGDGLAQSQISDLIKAHGPVIDDIVSDIQLAESKFMGVDKQRVNDAQVKALKKLVEQSKRLSGAILKDLDQ